MSVRELLHAEGRFDPGAPRVPWRRAALIVACAGFLHGACVGAFDVRPLQMAYSGLKVPILLALSTAICLPNFYAVNAVLGLRDDFRAALRAVFAAQATVAVALASTSPIVVLCYVSSSDYAFAIVANGALFAIAALAGQRTLGIHYRRLVARDPRHAIARRAWLALYVFVAIQLAWGLRPFVGDPQLATRFFRAGAWTNAYVVVARDVWLIFGERRR